MKICKYLTVIKSLSNKEKYKVLDEILTDRYKLIDKFSRVMIF